MTMDHLAAEIVFAWANDISKASQDFRMLCSSLSWHKQYTAQQLAI